MVILPSVYSGVAPGDTPLVCIVWPTYTDIGPLKRDHWNGRFEHVEDNFGSWK